MTPQEIKEKLGQESAFAVTDGEGVYELGMSKRFYAACAAMNGLLSNPEIIKAVARDIKTADKDLAKAAYEAADALLEKENE